MASTSKKSTTKKETEAKEEKRPKRQVVKNFIDV